MSHLPHLTGYQKWFCNRLTPIQHTASYCNNTIAGRSENSGLHMYMQCQGMSIVGTPQADQGPPNAGDNVTKYRKLTAAVCDTGLQTVQQKQ